MSSYDPEYLIAERRSPHALAAMLAATVSIGLHVALVLWLSSQEFAWDSSLFEQVLPERARRIFLRDVRTETSTTDARSEGEGSVGGAYGTVAELAANAEALGLSPDMVAIEPSAVPGDVMIGASGSIVEPAEFPEGDAWQPRQEIVKIERRIAVDEVTSLERKVIPEVARVRSARDALPRADISAERSSAPPDIMDIATLAPKEGGGRNPVPPREQMTAGDLMSGDPSLAVTEPRGKDGGVLFEEAPEEITDARPIENLLRAKATVYRSFRERKYGYVKIEVNRAGADVLPAIPKDVILVQDSSNSMTEQRMYFCRKGLSKCLKQVGPEDRFNVVSFQDAARFCFPTWQKNTPAAMAGAEAFVAGLTAGGNTDILAALRPLMSLDRTPGRPVIAFVVTDGRSTIGLTSSSDIIGRFTRGNDGRISVYMMGTVSSANAYLLDLLSYSNRGETRVVTKGRWDIPDAMEQVMQEVSRPVLTDVRFRLADPEAFEVHPALTGNLYLDRPLVLYGRFPKGREQLVIQAVGQAGGKTCDMIFDLALTGGEKGEREIREIWAEQKIYALMGQHARSPSSEVIAEIRKTAKDYRVRVPYEASLGL